MSYSFDSLVLKMPNSESPYSPSEAVQQNTLADQFDNYDKQKTLGKSRHLSAATRLLSSTALKLTQEASVNEMIEHRPNKVGVYIACENINLEDDFEFDLCAKNYGPDYVSPLKAPNTLANAVGSHFARFVGIKGPNCSVASGRIGTFQALDIAAMHIDSGAVETAIVGAVEVNSAYHSKLTNAVREASAVGAVRHSKPNDRVVFYPPNISTPSGDVASAVANKCTKLSAAYLNGSQIDELWVAMSDNNELESIVAPLRKLGVTSSVRAFAQDHLGGESVSGLLLAAMAEETLSQLKGEESRTIAILDKEAFGQLAVLLLEGRANDD